MAWKRKASRGGLDSLVRICRSGVQPSAQLFQHINLFYLAHHGCQLVPIAGDTVHDPPANEQIEPEPSPGHSRLQQDLRLFAVALHCQLVRFILRKRDAVRSDCNTNTDRSPLPRTRSPQPGPRARVGSVPTGRFIVVVDGLAGFDAHSIRGRRVDHVRIFRRVRKLGTTDGQLSRILLRINASNSRSNCSAGQAYRLSFPP